MGGGRVGRFTAVGCRHADGAHHAGDMVIEEVAMDEPVALAFLGRELDRSHAHRRHIDRVLQRRSRWVFVVRLDESEEMPVEVDGMVHHGVVHQAQAERLALLDLNRLGLMRIEPVEAPFVTDHIARQLERQLAVRGCDCMRSGRAELSVGRERTVGFLGAWFGVELIEDRS